MSQEKPAPVAGAIIWGIFLLFLGVIFLLQTTGVLPWGLWSVLWRFWPVIIIIIGISILLRYWNPWLLAGITVVILGVCLAIAIGIYGTPPQIGPGAQTYSQALETLQNADIEADFSATSLTLSSLPAGSTNLAEVNSTVPSNRQRITAGFQEQGNRGTLSLKTENVDDRLWGNTNAGWEVKLSPEIPLSLDLKSSASTLSLDLSGLDITDLNLDLDAGRFVVTMPASGNVTAVIKVDVSNLEITIPPGMATRIQATADVSSLNIDESRFPQSGGVYQSTGYGTASNKLELTIDADVSHVSVK